MQLAQEPLLLLAFRLAWGAAAVALALGLWSLGFSKVAKSTRDLLNGKLRTMIDAEVRSQDFERRLAQSSDIEECWARLRAGTVEFGFIGVRMVVDGRVFEELGRGNSERLWQLRIPLGARGYANFFRDIASLDQVVVTAFANAISRGLNGWLAAHDQPELPRKPVATESHFTAAAGDRAGES